MANLTAAEATFEGAHLAHVRDYYEHIRLADIAERCRRAIKIRARNLKHYR